MVYCLYQAIEICRRYTQLHADYADTIVAAMQASVSHGTPVNPPIWWVDPTDETALAVWDGKCSLRYSEKRLGDRLGLFGMVSG